MADYYTPTVVQQDIPAGLISSFEKLLLEHIFDCEQDDGKIYLHAWERPCDCITVDRAALADALSSATQKSRLRPLAEQLLAETNSDSGDIDLDLTTSLWGSDAYCIILQDIVRRAKDKLPYLTIGAAYTCSKMRPDGFGGHAIIITPRSIRYWSTNQFFEAFVGRFEKKQLATQSARTLP